MPAVNVIRRGVPASEPAFFNAVLLIGRGKLAKYSEMVLLRCALYGAAYQDKAKEGGENCFHGLVEFSFPLPFVNIDAFHEVV